MANHTNIPKLISIFFIRTYSYCFSPLTGSCCRFYPSCSAYALKAIVCYGFLKGWRLAVARLLCCHPWHKGGYDPVPTYQEKHHPVEPNTLTHKPAPLVNK